MGRLSILEKLDKVTVKAALFMRNNRYPVTLSKGTTALGRTLVKRNTEGLYDVIGADKIPVFKNITVLVLL